MEHSLQQERKSLKQICEMYRELPDFDGIDCAGAYEAEILGPQWLKTIAAMSLPFSGLPGWCGKRIHVSGAINRCNINGQIEERVSMLKSAQSSWIDGRPCMVLSYDNKAPLLLRPMRDEFRRVNETTLLGLSIYNLPLLKRVPLPFLLKMHA